MNSSFKDSPMFEQISLPSSLADNMSRLSLNRFRLTKEQEIEIEAAAAKSWSDDSANPLDAYICDPLQDSDDEGVTPKGEVYVQKEVKVKHNDGLDPYERKWGRYPRKEDFDPEEYERFHRPITEEELEENWRINIENAQATGEPHSLPKKWDNLLLNCQRRLYSTLDSKKFWHYKNEPNPNPLPAIDEHGILNVERAEEIIAEHLKKQDYSKK
eukprot:snap_masked-scaffold_2-processed-gene-6.24-mRNA-1 protein AED:1.00 eAED:1.00 QI:0/-1/0/0/-1/1/1/0/213